MTKQPHNRPEFFELVDAVLTGNESKDKLKLLLDNCTDDEKEYTAENGLFPEILCKDSDSVIRASVARSGYVCEDLAKDTCSYVQEEVAKAGNFLELLQGHKEHQVRRAVASHGYKPEVFAYDPSWRVRAEVANNLDCLDILQFDEDFFVRYVANKVLYTGEKMDDYIFDVRLRDSIRIRKSKGMPVF